MSRADSAARGDSGGRVVPVLPTVESSLQGWTLCWRPAARKRWEGERAQGLQGEMRPNAVSAQKHI